jgi:hypothetical protein
MSEYEKKLFCQYRRKCYNDGIKPKIIIKNKNEEKNNNLLLKNKLECKYRKSCYKSGKLPEELKINKDIKIITKILEGKKVF